MTIQVITANTTVQNATADEVFTGITDSKFDQGSPTDTDGGGTGTDLWVDNNAGAGFEYRSILKADLSNVPSGATINSATLYLYCVYAGSSGDKTIDCYPVRRNWTTDASWNNWSSGNAWTTGGCSDTTNDREATSAGAFTVPNTSGVYYSAGGAASALADYVQDVVDGVRANNYGFLIQATSVNTARLFGSNEGANGQRVEFVIDYTPPGGIVIPRQSLDGMATPPGGGLSGGLVRRATPKIWIPRPRRLVFA